MKDIIFNQIIMVKKYFNISSSLLISITSRKFSSSEQKYLISEVFALKSPTSPYQESLSSKEINSFSLLVYESIEEYCEFSGGIYIYNLVKILL